MQSVITISFFVNDLCTLDKREIHKNAYFCFTVITNKKRDKCLFFENPSQIVEWIHYNLRVSGENKVCDISRWCVLLLTDSHLKQKNLYTINWLWLASMISAIILNWFGSLVTCLVKPPMSAKHKGLCLSESSCMCSLLINYFWEFTPFSHLGT